MQLRKSRPPPPRGPLLLVAGAIFLAAGGRATAAGGAASQDGEGAPTAQADRGPDKGSASAVKAAGGRLPEDTASKHVGMEYAAYNDSDHITVFTPSIHAGLENVSGASLSASYLVDVVSAASADIVSTASRRWEEIRQAGTLSTQYKPHDFGVGVGGSVSSEPDYLSYGFYTDVIKDFDEKNWTLEFGYGFSHDTAGRCGTGGACTPFSVFSRDLQRGSFRAGLSWVVDRASLASVSMDVVLENGDQSKPYRYIPMFAPDVASKVPKGASIDWVNAERLPERPLEQLPLERHRASLTGRYAHRFEGSTARFEQRFYDDDWGVVASSTDVRWVVDLGSRVEFWPHARFNVESAASFWQRAYVSEPSGWSLPLYRTGDRELGPLWTAEGGGGLRWYLGSAGNPQAWQLGITGDAMYTSFLDDLYLTSRTGVLGAATLEAQW